MHKRQFGGYNIDHISLHASVFCLIPIFKYAKHICEGIPLTKEQYMIEYNLGFQLSKVLNVPVNNRNLHRLTPMKNYAFILKFIREMKITGDELLKGRIKPIYERIIYEKTNHRFSIDWGRLHVKVLPNYLKTFNYRAAKDILPFKTKFVDFNFDNDSRCNFYPSA